LRGPFSFPPALGGTGPAGYVRNPLLAQRRRQCVAARVVEREQAPQFGCKRGPGLRARQALLVLLLRLVGAAIDAVRRDARPVSRTSSGCRACGLSGRRCGRWLPGTARVGPLSRVKSSRIAGMAMAFRNTSPLSTRLARRSAPGSRLNPDPARSPYCTAIAAMLARMSSSMEAASIPAGRLARLI